MPNALIQAPFHHPKSHFLFYYLPLSGIPNAPENSPTHLGNHKNPKSEEGRDYNLNVLDLGDPSELYKLTWIDFLQIKQYGYTIFVILIDLINSINSILAVIRSQNTTSQ
jgi:hypothetical protein